MPRPKSGGVTTINDLYEEPAIEVAPAPVVEPEKHIIFIPSAKVAYEAVTVDKKTSKFITVTVNGKKYKVDCDKQVEVSEVVHEALKPLLGKLAR